MLLGCYKSSASTLKFDTAADMNCIVLRNISEKSQIGHSQSRPQSKESHNKEYDSHFDNAYVEVDHLELCRCGVRNTA